MLVCRHDSLQWEMHDASSGERVNTAMVEHTATYRSARRTQGSFSGIGGRGGFRASGDGAPPRYLLSTQSAMRFPALAADLTCHPRRRLHGNLAQRP